MQFKPYMRLAATASMLALGGLVLAQPAAAQDAPKKIEKIGLMVQDMSNPFFSAMTKGAEEAAKAIGASVNTQDAQLDLANQNTQIDAFIQQGVNLIWKRPPLPLATPSGRPASHPAARPGRHRPLRCTTRRWVSPTSPRRT